MNDLAPTGAAAALRNAATAFLARYDAVKAGLPGNSAIREAAATEFRATGLPGVREEAWRYTSLRDVAETTFSNSVGDDDVTAMLARLPAIDAPRLVFVNGRFRKDLSADIPGVRTGAPAFGTLARAGEKLVTLNTLLAEDGAAIDIAAGVDAGVIVMASLGTSGAEAASFHPRHAIRLGQGARLVLLEVAVGSGKYLHNPVLSAEIAEDAVLTHLRLQTESPQAYHLSTVYADVAARATYDSFLLTLGAKLARSEIHARLAGEKAMAHLNAAQLLGGSQHADFTTIVSHDAPATASRQTVRNVLDGRARGVFQGKIEVARIAQKTDGYQMNKTLLLSPHAEIDAKPQLEIYADDVKCSHGATIGALDPEQFFYLRSRGIPEAEARTMLVRAFLAEALDPISHQGARAAMEAAIAARWQEQPA